MRNKSMTATMLAVTMAGGLTIHAQATQTKPTEGTPQTQSDSRQVQNITVTGCLRDQSAMGGGASTGAAGSTSAATGSSATGTGSAGATGAGSAARSGQGSANAGQDFVLMNARLAQGSSASGLGTASAFQVEGLSDAELRKHVGHQVEVMGRLSGSMDKSGTTGATTGSAGTTGATGSTGATSSGSTGSGSTGSGSTAGAAGQRAGSGMGAADLKNLPKIQATSVKMVAATCPAAQ